MSDIKNRVFLYETLEDLRVLEIPIQSIPIHVHFYNDKRLKETISGKYKISKTLISWNRICALVIFIWGTCGFIWGWHGRDATFPGFIFLIGVILLIMMILGDIWGAWIRRHIEYWQLYELINTDWMIIPALHSPSL